MTSMERLLKHGFFFSGLQNLTIQVQWLFNMKVAAQALFYNDDKKASEFRKITRLKTLLKTLKDAAV